MLNIINDSTIKPAVVLSKKAKIITWTTSDKAIATVNYSRKVTAKKKKGVSGVSINESA